MREWSERGGREWSRPTRGMGAARAALSEASRALLSDSRVRTPTSTVRCNTFVVHVDDDVAELEFEVRGVPEARDERPQYT